MKIFQSYIKKQKQIIIEFHLKNEFKKKNRKRKVYFFVEDFLQKVRINDYILDLYPAKFGYL